MILVTLPLLSIVVILLIIVGSGINVCRHLVYKRNQVDCAFAAIDALCKKRYILIPYLVALIENRTTIDGMTLRELNRLTTIVKVVRVHRRGRLEMEDKISQELKKIYVALKAYPIFSFNPRFIYLKGSLNDIEEQIAATKLFYNTSVDIYNKAIVIFPTDCWASVMDYQLEHKLDVMELEKNAVKVN